MANTLDWNASYQVPPDLLVLQRDDATVQIGTDPPRRTLVLDAPPETFEVLSGLAPAVTAGDVVRRAGGDPLLWQDLFETLLAAGFVVPAKPVREAIPHLAGERLALAHRYGAAAADRVLTARSDALVVVDGPGPVGETVAALLAAAGIGHVHHESAPSRAATDLRRFTTPVVSRTGLARPAPPVRLNRPAPQLRPSAVVLAQPSGPDLTRVADLLLARVPHLAVQVGAGRVTVGPLVLPGRSACLNCLDRHRRDADPGWPAVAAAQRGHAVAPATLVAHTAATLAAEQILDWIDGQRRPDTVDGTVELLAPSPAVARRAWSVHPDCACRDVAARA